ncbi:hypothetical protein G6F68_013092 [Rhizopus microsporus]|nr:hypothetical protein G6F68_013092 [Rhizopus microsporus]
MAPRQLAAAGSGAHFAPDRVAGRRQPGGAGRIEHLARTQGLPGFAAPGLDDRHRDPGRRHPQDRPRNPRAAASNVQYRGRPLRRALPQAVRRGRGQAQHDRRGNPGRRRAGDGPTSGQAQQHDPPALWRRESADRELAGVRAVQVEPGAVLPAGRGGRPAGRREHRTLCEPGCQHERANPVPVHLAQQDRHADGKATDRDSAVQMMASEAA